MTAKGIEDTAFYRYVRLLALNDVGGDLAGLRPPEKPAVDDGDAEVGGGSGAPDPVG